MVTVKNNIVELQKELKQILFNRAKVDEKDIYRIALAQWVNNHTDLLTASERMKFKPVLL